MVKKEFIVFVFWRTISNFLILFAIFGLIATFGPSIYYEASYQIGKIRGIKYELAPQLNSDDSGGELSAIRAKYMNNGQLAEEGPSLLEQVEAKSGNTKVLVPPNTDFSIVVPKIGASEKVQPNVDPSNKEEYLRVLVDSIAHAKGTAFPGINGTTYLFAHSADNF